jgi:hypothetical protein
VRKKKKKRRKKKRRKTQDRGEIEVLMEKSM